MTTTAFRKEKDILGELEVPAEACYGIQTARAVENFPISSGKEFLQASVGLATFDGQI